MKKQSKKSEKELEYLTILKGELKLTLADILFLLKVLSILQKECKLDDNNVDVFAQKDKIKMGEFIDALIMKFEHVLEISKKIKENETISN